jgi:hypothetical protein
MVSAWTRVQHYLARTAPELIGIDLPAMLPQQQANYAARTIELYAKQVLCCDILNEEGISAVFRFAYHSFNNRCYKAWLSSHGAALADEVDRLLTIFVARGLLSNVLHRIASEIWLIPDEV